MEEDLWLERIALPNSLAELGVPNGLEIITLHSVRISQYSNSPRLDSVYGHNHNSGRNSDGVKGPDLNLVDCVRLPFPVDIEEMMGDRTNQCNNPMLRDLVVLLGKLKTESLYQRDIESLSYPSVYNAYLIRRGDFYRDKRYDPRDY